MRKKCLKLVSVLTIATLSVACSHVSEGKSSSASNGSLSENTSQIESLNKMQDNGNEITIWCGEASNVKAMKSAIEIYKKENTSANIKVENKTVDDIQASIENCAKSGKIENLADIFLIEDQKFVKNLEKYREVFYDLTNLGVKFSDFSEAKVANSVTDEKNYGVPCDSNTVIGCYRTDLLKEAGFTIEDFTDITWDEYIEKSEQVISKTGKPMLTTIKDEPDLLYMMFQSAGISVFDEDFNVKIKDNEALKRTVEIYATLEKEGILEEKSDWNAYIDSINSGEVVSAINGSWINDTIMATKDESQKGKWAITNMPKLPDVKGATNYSAQDSSTWAVCSKTDNIGGVINFFNATWAGSTEFYDSILNDLGMISSYLPSADSNAYKEKINYFGNEPIYSKMVEYGKHIPKVNKGLYVEEEKSIFGKNMSKLVNGEKDVDTILKELDDVVESVKN